MYKAYNDLSPSLMQSVFPQSSISYDLRKKNPLNQQTSTQSIMEPKQYLTGVQKFGHWFQKISSALNPLLNLKSKLETGNRWDAHVDYVKCTYLILAL